MGISRASIRTPAAGTWCWISRGWSSGRPRNFKGLKTRPTRTNFLEFPPIGVSPSLQADSPEIAGPVLRPALGLFGVLVVRAGVHRKGHHQRFGRGVSSVAMGRAFVRVLSWPSSSW